MTTTFELPRGTPEEMGTSGESLDRVRDVVHQFIDDNRIQYAVVGVAHRGKVVYFEAQPCIRQPVVLAPCSFETNPHRSK